VFEICERAGLALFERRERGVQRKPDGSGFRACIREE